jgi:diacylglycerol O-acyltransferase / wax synthase
MLGLTSQARLSALDASFLEAESPTAHMHVGWVALFRPPADGPVPDFGAIRRLIQARLHRAPRYRQRLAPVPLGLHDPIWVDDTEFDIRHHVRRSGARHIEKLVDRVYSAQLDRRRPLWELWIADGLEDGRMGVVGKVHHCMVDGIAAVELASLFLDASPRPEPVECDDWNPAPPPGGVDLVARAIRDRAIEELQLLRLPVRIASSPRYVGSLARQTTRVARSFRHSLAPLAPRSSLNEAISPARTLAMARRPLVHLKEIKKRFGASVNDVVLAAATGGVRRFQQRRGEDCHCLKAMVPVNVRGEGRAGDLGNRISFVFLELPCDEPDPVRRLKQIRATMSDRKRTGEPLGAQAMLDALVFAPRRAQHAITQVVSSPRTFNLTVSNIPGPSVPMWMAGRALEEVYPVVPLAERHGIAIGFTTLVDQGFFGVYADPETVPDANLLARDIEHSVDELRRQRPPGRSAARPVPAGH